MEGEVNKLIHFKIMGDKGAERAVESLSMMLDTDVNMNISSVNMVSLITIPDIVGSDEVVSLFSPFTGAVSGSMFCLLSPDSTKKIASVLLGDFDNEESDEMFDEMQQSAAAEIGNIITSSFVDVWADTFGIELSHEPPTFTYDFADAIVDNVLIEASQSSDFVIFFNSTLKVTNMDIDFNILMMPDTDSLQKVFDLFESVEPESLTE